MKEHLHISRAILREHQAGLVDEATLLDLYRVALESTCPECAAESRAYREELRTGDEVTTFAELVRTSLRRGDLPNTRPVRKAHDLLNELLRLQGRSRQRAVEKNPSRYCSAHLVALLLDHIRTLFPGDPGAAEELAELVQDLALHLDEHEAGEFRHAALISALALKACSYRVRDNLRQASEYIRLARIVAQQEGVTDSLALAELDLHDGALLKDQGSDEDAEEKLSRAAFSYLLQQRASDGVRSLILLAGLHRIHERFDLALAAVDAASASVNATDRLLSIYVEMERAVIECDQGNYDAAEAIIGKHRTQIERRHNLADQFRLAWLEGRIALGRRQHDAALNRLGQARSYCHQAGNSYDAALISLDIDMVQLDRSGPPGRS